MILLERPERARWVKAAHRTSAPGQRSQISRVTRALLDPWGSGWKPRPLKGRDWHRAATRCERVRRRHAPPARHADTNSAGSMEGTPCYGSDPRWPDRHFRGMGKKPAKSACAKNLA